jgi:hypothetical protein
LETTELQTLVARAVLGLQQVSVRHQSIIRQAAAAAVLILAVQRAVRQRVQAQQQQQTTAQQIKQAAVAVAGITCQRQVQAAAA